ncbi:LacI family DNA-binding transcriptional regulator [Rathayibacter sp. AY1F3]|uniref:LacI family DNA-binding transcriptional regulator n=1 Tax=Rathayibacter sp. AY1F3 TaxID=2080558 RepID=UPI00280071C4|nr:LacI family DNA-binding transcriptional regulator [Rathayibacter sp. AY1F3]
MTGKSAGRLGPDLQARIATAVSELGYRANKTAQRLSRGTGKTIAFVFPGFHYHYFGSILEGIHRVLDREWQISFVDSRPHDSRLAPESIFASSIGPDTSAVLVASPSAHDLAALALVEGPRRLIADSPLSLDGAGLATYDLGPAVRAATTDLLDHGHRRIGYIGLDSALSLSLLHRRKLVEDGVTGGGGVLRVADLAPSGPRVDVTARKLLRSWKEQGITAIIAADERLAYAVVRAATEEDLRLPEDFSLLSFNDSDAAALLSPALASIRLPPEELGRAAGTLLSTPRGADRTITIAAEYIRRSSIAAADSR